MKLRDHPALIAGGQPSWPPIWVHSGMTSIQRVYGELGNFSRHHFAQRHTNGDFYQDDFRGKSLHGISWRERCGVLLSARMYCCRAILAEQFPRSAILILASHYSFVKLRAPRALRATWRAGLDVPATDRRP